MHLGVEDQRSRVFPLRRSATSFDSNDPSAELTVTIDPGEDTPFSPITLQTHDIQGLRRLLDECKRLKEAFGTFAVPYVRWTRVDNFFLPSLASETPDDYDFEPFGWVAPYIADHALPPLRACSLLMFSRCIW